MQYYVHPNTQEEVVIVHSRQLVSPYITVYDIYTEYRKGGSVVLVGLPKSPIHVEKPLEDIVFKSLTLKTVHGRKIFHTWEETERIVAQNL